MEKIEKNYNVKGFTILEVLIALCVLAVSLTAILKANGENQEAAIESAQMTVSGMLGASKINEIEAEGIDDWTENSGDFGDDYTKYTWNFESELTDMEGIQKGTLVVMKNEKSVLTIERIFLENEILQ